MINIGFDFDNTIIIYDDLFYKVSKKYFELPENILPDKETIKNYYQKINKEKIFTKIQGLVYGNYIKEAKPADNIVSFMNLLNASKEFNLFIISHKTKYPISGKKINLHTQANDWIEKNLTFNNIQLIPKKEYIL